MSRRMDDQAVLGTIDVAIDLVDGLSDESVRLTAGSQVIEVGRRVIWTHRCGVSFQGIGHTLEIAGPDGLTTITVFSEIAHLDSGKELVLDPWPPVWLKSIRS